MCMSSDKAITTTGSTQDIVIALREAERLFSSGLQTFLESGKSTYIRHAAVSLALVRAFQTLLGYSGRQSSNFICNLLGSLWHSL